VIQYIDQQLIVSKTIDFSNAEQVYRAGLKHIQQHKSFPLIVDLGQLEQGNTLWQYWCNGCVKRQITKVYILKMCLRKC
jgi:hypothetical protein